MYTNNIRKLCSVFVLSFGLNLLWEQAHSVLYASYQGVPITEFVLLRAAVGDAIILTVLFLPFFYFDFFKKRTWLIIPLGILVSVIIELYALHTGRWVYTQHMPLVPFLHIGLTPTIQLGLLGYLVYLFILPPHQLRSGRLFDR